MLNVHESLKVCIAVMVDHYQALFAQDALQSLDFVQGNWAAMQAVHAVIITGYYCSSVLYSTVFLSTALNYNVLN